MMLEAIGFAAIGFAAACAAVRRFPHRFPSHRLVLATGPVSALLGGFLTHAILGSGHVLLDLMVAVGFAAALLSLLVRPARRPRASAPRAA
jgi:hypothetical protein